MAVYHLCLIVIAIMFVIPLMGNVIQFINSSFNTSSFYTKAENYYFYLVMFVAINSPLMLFTLFTQN